MKPEQSSTLEDLLRDQLAFADQVVKLAETVQAEVDEMTARLNRVVIAARLNLSAVPDRMVRAVVECERQVGDEDDWEARTPCPFAGEVDVVIFDDTREALWACPSCGQENDARTEVFS